MKKKSMRMLSALLTLLLLAGCSGRENAISSETTEKSTASTSLSVTPTAGDPIITTPQSGTTSAPPTTTKPITLPIPDPT